MCVMNALQFNEAMIMTGERTNNNGNTIDLKRKIQFNEGNKDIHTYMYDQYRPTLSFPIKHIQKANNDIH